MAPSTQHILWLLIPATPVALWIAWSDLKSMRIPNISVLIMLAVFVVFGLIALPFDTYLWRLLHVAIVLAIGFGANALKLIGGGDAKYAAAIAAFVAAGDYRFVLVLFGIMLLAAFATHRVFRKIGFIRRLTPNWKSWQAGLEFPMGLALSGTLLVYLALGL